jgi:hypothetical protein
MPLILDGTNGISNVQSTTDGSAATPAVRGTDANTGIFFPAADTIAFAEGGAEAMRIDSAGNVGIGTTSPSVKFQVNHSSDVAAINASGGGVTLGMSNSSANDVLLRMTNNSSNFYDIRNLTSGSAFTIGYNGTERMRITSGGNLLVGTTTVQNAGNAIACFGGFYSFCLNSGSFNYYFGTDSNNFNVYSGDGVLRGYLGTAGAWTNTSDISYKKDIVNIQYGLQDALNLRPVSYVTKDYEIPQIGFIAQEMEQVIPEVVSGKDGSKGISYGSLVALCVKAIQDLNAKVDAQATTIQELKATVDAQAARIAALEAAQ